MKNGSKKAGASQPPVRIRRFRASDVPALRDWLAAGVIAGLTRYSFPMSIEAAASRYHSEQAARLSHKKAVYRFAILTGSQLIGICSLHPPMFSGMELSIGIFDSVFHNRGVGRRAIDYVCRFAFERLGLKRIELGVYPWNIRAIRCYQASGFRREALLRNFLYHDGKYHDVLWMSRLQEADGIGLGKKNGGEG